jgi:hypothetical protein
MFTRMKTSPSNGAEELNLSNGLSALRDKTRNSKAMIDEATGRGLREFMMIVLVGDK